MKKLKNVGTDVLEVEENKLQPVLLEENEVEIGRLRSMAGTNAYQLNALHQRVSIPGQQGLQQVIKNSDKIVFDELLRRSPEAKRLSDGGFDVSKMPMRKPQEVEELERLIGSLKRGDATNFVRFDDEEDKWVVDQEALNRQIARFQVWAETEKELERLTIAQALCDYMQRYHHTQSFSVQRLRNDMFETKGDMFIPSKRFVKNG